MAFIHRQHTKECKIMQTTGLVFVLSNLSYPRHYYEQCTDIAPADSTLGRPHLESELLVDNALLIAQLQRD